MLSTSVTALALSAFAAAAPLSRREYSDATPVQTCSLALNQSVTSQIRHSIDTRSAWVPQQNEDGEYTTVEVNTLGTDNPYPTPFTIIPTDNNTYKIQLTQDVSLCAAGSGTGGNSSVVNFVPCDSEFAEWNITCETCAPTFGGECEFSPTHLSFSSSSSSSSVGGSDSSPVCASVPSEQYGALALKPCNPFVSPNNFEQLFYFGRLF